jgi:hypothetical protein
MMLHTFTVVEICRPDRVAVALSTETPNGRYSPASSRRYTIAAGWPSAQVAVIRLATALGLSVRLTCRYPGEPGRTVTGMAINKPVVFGILGGLAWFVIGLLIGHFVWT